jgi:hypothetical protein
MVVAQGGRMVELDADNTRLQSELEQAHEALPKANAARSSLSTNQEEIERECALPSIYTFKQEKAQVMTNREANVVVEHKKFWDYRLGHRWKLCKLRVNLDGAVNEIGVRCLPYPRKGSTISKIFTWFDKEIQALPNAIAKANKNFLVYCLVGVLKMLQGHAECHHVDGLEAIMRSCDASTLEVPNDIAKLATHIVKIWWSSYGLPYVTEAFMSS